MHKIHEKEREERKQCKQKNSKKKVTQRIYHLSCLNEASTKSSVTKEDLSLHDIQCRHVPLVAQRRRQAENSPLEKVFRGEESELIN